MMTDEFSVLTTYRLSIHKTLQNNETWYKPK